MKDEIDTVNNVNKARLYNFFENKYGRHFLLKLDCVAGGNCAMFYLLSFNNNNQFFKKEKLGNETGEASESTYFEYKRNSDTTIVTYQIRYDNENDKVIDTIKKFVVLGRH